MAERYLQDLLTQTEQVSLEEFSLALSHLARSGQIESYCPNNFECDTMRGTVDFWVTKAGRHEPIPLCVLDGRMYRRDLLERNPGLPIIQIIEDGELIGHSRIKRRIMNEIDLYVQCGTNIRKLLEMKREVIRGLIAV